MRFSKCFEQKSLIAKKLQKKLPGKNQPKKTAGMCIGCQKLVFFCLWHGFYETKKKTENKHTRTYRYSKVSSTQSIKSAHETESPVQKLFKHLWIEKRFKNEKKTLKKGSSCYFFWQKKTHFSTNFDCKRASRESLGLHTVYDPFHWKIFSAYYEKKWCIIFAETRFVEKSERVFWQNNGIKKCAKAKISWKAYSFIRSCNKNSPALVKNFKMTWCRKSCFPEKPTSKTCSWR